MILTAGRTGGQDPGGLDPPRAKLRPPVSRAPVGHVRSRRTGGCEVRCEDLIFRIQASVSHVHMISGHDRTHHLMKSKPYSHRTSQGVLLKSRVTASNGPIQRTRTVPRACSAIQLYSARVYSCAIQHTAYTLYSPIRRSSGMCTACTHGSRGCNFAKTKKSPEKERK